MDQNNITVQPRLDDQDNPGLLISANIAKLDGAQLDIFKRFLEKTSHPENFDIESRVYSDDELIIERYLLPESIRELPIEKIPEIYKQQYIHIAIVPTEKIKTDGKVLAS